MKTNKNSVAVLFALFPVMLFATSLTEPPAVVYGKVIQIGQGTTYQIFDGELVMTLVNENDPGGIVTRTTRLRATGSSGEFSYRIEFPQKYLPVTEELGESLSVGRNEINYRFDSITIDGVEAGSLDAFLPLIAVSFANRAEEHRMDLKVSLELADSDGDGMPDWWEDLHGLNSYSADDAVIDTDGDGMSNLEEFLAATDPNEANYDPLVQTASLVTPVGGISGLYLMIVDQNTDPSGIQLTLQQAGAGLRWQRADAELLPGEPFSYADVLAGDITVQVAEDFVEASVPMSLEDLEGTNGPSSFVVALQAFSPIHKNHDAPAIWLHAQSLETPGPLAEWADSSGNGCDGYHYLPAACPVFNPDGVGSVDFAEPQFMYVDDKGLLLGDYTVFLAFNLAAHNPEDQMLFSNPDLQVGIGGTMNAEAAQSVTIVQDGQKIPGPVLHENEVSQLTIAGGTGAAFVRSHGDAYWPAVTTADSALSTFATLGALQQYSDASAHSFFDGKIHELLIYNLPLDADSRARHEDYQQARWDGWTVWDYRNETVPLLLTGSPQSRNAINGGWGNDTLTGGDLSDVLRGGFGDDQLAGGGGADRFQVIKGHGNDRISDFSIDDGDLIDLGALFGDQQGSPDDYVTVRVEVSRDENNIPIVNTVLDLDYDGIGSDADQALTLEGLALSQSDLPRLVGEGIIELGGPKYDTAVAVAAAETAFIKTAYPREFTITRTGNLDAELEVALSFTGNARLDNDYAVVDAYGSGVVYTVSFARGEAEQQFRLIPVQDDQPQSEEIQVMVLSSPWITGRPADPLQLTLEEAPLVSVQTVQHASSASNGVVQILRGGSLDEALTVGLDYGGTLVAGSDYETLPAFITLPAGQTNIILEITPTVDQVSTTLVDEVQITVLSDPQYYALGEYQTASVVILDASHDPIGFAAWRQTWFPGDTSAELSAQDPDDDGLSNLLEYILGTNPGLADADGAGQVRLYLVDGQIELRVITISGLTDVVLSIEGSDDLGSGWADRTGLFACQQYWLEDGRVEHHYRSTRTAAEEPSSGFYRLGITVK